MSLDLQAVFNRVRSALLVQGKKSVNPIPGSEPELQLRCAYRGFDGCKCAIGHLIADEHYRPELEGFSVAAEIVREALTKSGINFTDVVGLRDGDVDFLVNLQRVHDDFEVAGWRRAFDEFARRYCLGVEP